MIRPSLSFENECDVEEKMNSLKLDMFLRLIWCIKMVVDNKIRMKLDIRKEKKW